MHVYLDLVRQILDHGHEERNDRTGTGTLKIFGPQMRFNLKNDEFPLLTTKQVFFKGLVLELRRMLLGDTSASNLHADGVKIWDEWGLTPEQLQRPAEQRLALATQSKFAASRRRAQERRRGGNADEFWLRTSRLYSVHGGHSPGDLGPVYGAPWRRWPMVDQPVVEMTPRKGPEEGSVQPPEHATDAGRYKHPYAGDLPIRWDNNGNAFDIIATTTRRRDPNLQFLVIRFAKTGSLRTVSRQVIIGGEPISDAYAPSIMGIGCLGQVPGADATYAYSLWIEIMKRCYDPQNKLYSQYGARGAYVSPRWLCYENFYRDIKQIPGYERWTADPHRFYLCKDYYASDCYDVSTCVFFEHVKRFELMPSTRVFEVVTSRGQRWIHLDFKSLCRTVGIEAEQMNALLEGKETPRKAQGWVIREITPSEGKVFRRKLYHDQMSELVDNLKNKPFSRRHVVSAWWPEVLPDESRPISENILEGRQSLAPCHCLFQCFVRKLSVSERVELWKQKHTDSDDISEHPDTVLQRFLDSSQIPDKALSLQLYQRKQHCALAA